MSSIFAFSTHSKRRLECVEKAKIEDRFLSGNETARGYVLRM
jgi:hypothetical protein